MGISPREFPLSAAANPVLECRSSKYQSDASEIETTKGALWQTWSAKRRESFVRRAVVYWRRKGFPYYKLTPEEVRREFACLSAYDHRKVLARNEIISNNLGLRLANYFHPQMWHVRCTRYLSPFETFCQDEKLARAIRRALTIWPDRYGANASCLRRILKSFSNTVGVSNFRPTAAAAIMRRYSPPRGCVLDFSAGYGGRLLGAEVTGRSYYGIDPGIDQIRGLRAIAQLARAGCSSTAITIRRGAAECILPDLPTGSFDLVFSSPPYFDREKYGSEREQSFIRYPSIDDWRYNFLQPIIQNSARVLKPNGYLVLNVCQRPRNLAAMTVEIARRDFLLEKVWRLLLAKLPYKRLKAADAYKWEPILVFRKRQ